mmetsp:Transcript_53238/g.142442  ORF Transcript_53238/g.142442 Transcript_53238/m.142442 type:complete len:242 (+) Transcript_53238:553-1278(+)
MCRNTPQFSAASGLSAGLSTLHRLADGLCEGPADGLRSTPSCKLGVAGDVESRPVLVSDKQIFRPDTELFGIAPEPRRCTDWSHEFTWCIKGPQPPETRQRAAISWCISTETGDSCPPANDVAGVTKLEPIRSVPVSCEQARSGDHWQTDADLHGPDGAGSPHAEEREAGGDPLTIGVSHDTVTSPVADSVAALAPSKFGGESLKDWQDARAPDILVGLCTRWTFGLLVFCCFGGCGTKIN